MAHIVINKIRIQYLCGGIVRIERAACGKFCDKNTLVVPDRASLCGDTVLSAEEQDGYTLVDIDGYTLFVPTTGNTLSGIKMLDKNGKVVYRYKKLKNSGELPTADKTPEVFVLADNPRVTVPEYGYSYKGKKKNNGYAVEQNANDVYLLICKKDARLLRKLYISLTGRSELVRLSTLGLWDSRYYVYSEETAKQRIEEYEKRGVPLDNMVIDTDWRQASDRGIGYDVNTQLFPNIKRFFDFAHSHGINVMFNDHPEPYENSESVLSPEEVKYREENLQRLLSLGLDMWWYDRNWTTVLKTPVKAIAPETWGMYAFAEITKHYYKKRDGEIFTRPDIMANVNNIYHGSYGGAYGNCKNSDMTIADSISHRYSVQWTGDISTDYCSLAREVGNMLGGGNNCIPYVNADCGGHIGNPNKNEYIRWMQFGAFSPVFRPHCSISEVRTREPWAYDDETFNIVNEYIKLRYRLLPVIYKEAYESYLYGTPIFKPLAFDYPEDKKAVKRKDEYLLGNNILIAPIAEYGAVERVPEKNFIRPVTATYFDGTEWSGKPLLVTQYKDLYKYWSNVKPHDEVPMYNFSARYETVLKFDKDVKLFVESDDGVIIYIDGKIVHEDRSFHSPKRVELVKLSAGREYNVRLDYFQGGGGATIALLYSQTEVNDIDERTVYLPKGKWIDVFTGKVYSGGKSVKRKYAVGEMPIFVRSGAVIPLAYNAKNTKEQTWDKLVFDFYPDKEFSDEGYIYEDDAVTTAYKSGQLRTSKYSAVYSDAENAFVLKFDKSQGSFDGVRAFESREIKVRIHGAKRFNPNKIQVNGQDVGFGVRQGKKCAFPFGSESVDGYAEFSFTQNVYEDYCIKIYLSK